jgi:uroporphyrin-III C-methyltransferase/precorrin-2 dehydrogenase/sirohydrochlorin ferrochelatase
MKYFPIFVDADYIDCLLVGAGEVAARKCELLLKTPAKITIVAPWVSDAVKELSSSNQITLIEREFEDTDLKGKNMVFVATDKLDVNAYIHDLAHSQNIMVNVVDNTPLCKFITPSIVDRSPIIIAMSSGGVAPVLLRYIRQKLESTIPSNIKRLGEFSQRFRDKVKSGLSNVTDRRYFWEAVLDGETARSCIKQVRQW